MRAIAVNATGSADVLTLATREELQRRASDLFACMSSGRLDVRIGHTFPLAEAAQAHRDLEARPTTGKALLP